MKVTLINLQSINEEQYLKRKRVDDLKFIKNKR